MNNTQKKQLDRYFMMIVSKYFKSVSGFIKVIQVCKKFKEIPEMFHYNPVKLQNKTKLFPNIETYHIYNKKDRIIVEYDNYVYWYQVNYEKYLNKKENVEYKKVRFCRNDWAKHDSYEYANILGKKSMSLFNHIEIDLTGITKLEKSCFNGNKTVQKIKLDKRISTIPDYCFKNCTSLKELDLSYVKILGNSCFSYCQSLTALTLPELFHKNENNCFSGIPELKKIETNGVKLIEADMNYSLYKSFKRNGIDVKGIISYERMDRLEYGNEIPEEVSIIGMSCFYCVTTLGDVILPKSVSKLEDYCFCNCSIKSIDLSNVIEITFKFESCTQLTSVTLSKRIIKSSENNEYYQIYNKVTALKNIELIDTNHIPIVSNHLRKIMNEKGYHYEKCIYTFGDLIETNSIIPEEANIIDCYVFYCKNGIKTSTIPSNVNNIYSYNFNSMESIENIKIHSEGVKCGEYCFCDLLKIKELDLRGITSFGPNCLCNCSSLTKLIIQNVLIENGLIGCDSLKEIEIIGIENNEYEHPINYKLAHILENKGIHCKTKVFSKYESINNEESYQIPNGINEIGINSFYYASLKELTIPSSITLIKKYAFNYCHQLTHLIIEGNPEIQQSAIYCCYELVPNQPELKQYSI